MKNLSVLILLLAFPMIMFGQEELKGFVGDAETRAPLPYAHVVVSGTYLASVTKTDGTFVLKGLKQDTVTLEVSYLGYEKQLIRVKTGSQPLPAIYLEPSVFTQEEVVVSATRADEQSPVTFSTIDKKEIAQLSFGQDMPYLLRNSPSVVTSSDAGTGIGYTNIRIRGTDLTRINVTINGVPLNDAESHGVWWVDLPDIASSVDNVQIQRGVGTSTNGAAAFGASINLQTQQVNEEPYAGLSLTGGSFNTIRSTLTLGSGLVNDRWTFDGRISGLHSDGYIDRASSELLSYFISSGYYHKNAILKLTIFSGREKTYQAWDGIPSYILDTNRTFNGLGYYIDNEGNERYYDNQTDNYAQTQYQLSLVRKLAQNWNLSTAAFLTRGKGYYEEYKMDQEFSAYGLENPVIGGDTLEETDLVRQRWLDNYFYGGTFAVSHDDQQRLKMTAGGAFAVYDGDHYGKVIWPEIAVNMDKDYRWYESTGFKTDGNLYARANYQVLSYLNIYADLQYRYIDYRIEGIDNDLRDISQAHRYHFINPKAGILLDINSSHQAYLSFAVANREPNRSTLIDANPELGVPQPERLYDLEAGYRLKHSLFTSEFNVYYMRYQDQLVLTGKINDVGDPVMENVPESYRTGLEVSLGWKVIDNLEWNITGTISSNKIPGFTEYVDNWDAWPEQLVNDRGKTDIAFSPSLLAGSSLLFEPIRGLSLNLISRYVGKQYIDNTSSNDRMLDAYFVSDFIIRYSIHPKFIKEIGFSVQVNNMLNTEYETNAWVYRYYSEGSYGVYDGYFPQAGIHFFAGINLSF
jgi:iron complex outermembrane receptor protein